MIRMPLPALLLLLTGCAAPLASSTRLPMPATDADPAYQGPPSAAPHSRPTWQTGQPLMHGFIGVTQFQDVTVEEDGPGHIDGDAGDLDELPLLGGGAQWKLGGERIDYGLEALGSFSWRANAEAFVVGGGGAAVAIDVDMFLLELFGGPFASAFLGDRFRIYGGAGPLMQFADYAQSGSGLSDDGSGFGFGWYARTGFEFLLSSRTMIGLGARWSDTTVDLGSGLGDLEIDGLQAMLTVSVGL